MALTEGIKCKKKNNYHLKKTSREAAAFYMENRYTYYSSCAESCLRMEVEAKFKSKAPSDSAKIGVLIPREVMVIQEYYSITLTSTGGLMYIL